MENWWQLGKPKKKKKKKKETKEVIQAAVGLE
jgi:hypothetical protein